MINILGQTWSIQYRPIEELGICDNENKTLIINPKQDKTEQESTELHEALHAILCVSGVSSVLTDEIEEAVVTAIENGLYQAGYRRQQ